MLAAVMVPWAQAAAWSDDFNDMNISDGNPVTWNTNLLGIFPGTYDASSGDFSLSRPGSGNNNQLGAWVDNMSFGDTYIRAQGTIVPGTLPEETGGNLALLARLSTSPPPDGPFAYVLYIDDGGQMGLQILQGGLTDIVPTVELGDINAATDVIMELNIIGNELRGFAWRPGESKPAEPQISAFDNSFAMGKAGIGYDEDDDNTSGVFRWVMAQDTPFVDTIAGDFNTDGIVDAADYVFWRDRLGNPFTQDDYNVWRANFDAAAAGAGSGAFSSSVPEPLGCILLVLGMVGVISMVRARQVVLAS
jgi:hypothetical protein